VPSQTNCMIQSPRPAPPLHHNPSTRFDPVTRDKGSTEPGANTSTSPYHPVTSDPAESQPGFHMLVQF